MFESSRCICFTSQSRIFLGVETKFNWNPRKKNVQNEMFHWKSSFEKKNVVSFPVHLPWDYNILTAFVTKYQSSYASSSLNVNDFKRCYYRLTNSVHSRLHECLCWGLGMASNDKCLLFKFLTIIVIFCGMFKIDCYRIDLIMLIGSVCSRYLGSNEHAYQFCQNKL